MKMPGEVVALGSEVLDSEGQPFRVGDRIVPGANVVCGACPFCHNNASAHLVSVIWRKAKLLGAGKLIATDCFPSRHRFAEAFVDMGLVAINPNSDICTKNVSVIGIGGETVTSYVPSMRLMAANLAQLPFENTVTHHMPLVYVLAVSSHFSG